MTLEVELLNERIRPLLPASLLPRHKPPPKEVILFVELLELLQLRLVLRRTGRTGARPQAAPYWAYRRSSSSRAVLASPSCSLAGLVCTYASGGEGRRAFSIIGFQSALVAAAPQDGWAPAQRPHALAREVSMQ